ncbi:MAG: DNA mismatch repair endonuclease MutL [Phycisphaerae bacterium]
MKNESMIRVLPPLLVNKIAAGEVVERPASVVKELLDNAIDAGATRIALTIEDGGKRSIRVTDDGCGMTADDLELAVTPHATSKIQEEADLDHIASMGFRGEALASIASVSKMRITSRKRDEIEGAVLNISGVDKRSQAAAGCPTGTTIEVRDLFFNVPARRKFLRATSTETGHINDHFARAALAFPGITFSLTNNGRQTHNLPACDNRVARIGKFYGEELSQDLLHRAREERGLRMEAYLAPPARSRANSQWQFTFINDRFIRDKYIQHAVKEAYRGLMEHNRHAVVFLFLYIDPSEVDVNVHPTKIEVRWAESNLIHSQVLSLLKETLQAADLTPVLRTQRAVASAPRDVVADEHVQQRMREELASMLKADSSAMHGTTSRHGGTGHHGGAGTGMGGSTGSPASFRHADSGYPRHDRRDPLQSWRGLYGSPSQDGSPSSGDPLSPSTPEYSDQTPDHGSSTDDVAAQAMVSVEGRKPRAIQIHNLYLVAEYDDGIVIIDQHALHERIMYEQLKGMLDRGDLESQGLLIPSTFSANASQMALMQEHVPLFEKLGIDVRPFGPDTMAVHAFPALLKKVDVSAFMLDLLDQLEGKPEGSAEVVVHEVLDMMACKAAIKAGDPLTQPEIDALLEQRHLVEKSSNCPHGRPTTLRLTKADLNRQFHRT